MRPRTVPQPGINLDYFMWQFTRLSGLFLVLLAAIGFTYALLLGARTQIDLPTLLRWTFFPNPNHVINSNVPDVTLGWANAFWQIMEYLIIFFAFTHAASSSAPDSSAASAAPVIGGSSWSSAPARSWPRGAWSPKMSRRRPWSRGCRASPASAGRRVAARATSTPRACTTPRWTST